MERVRSFVRSLIVVICLAAVHLVAIQSAHALDQAACETRVAPIEARMKSGDYPDHAVQGATQMIDSIRQNCGNINEELLDVMMAGFDALLPVAGQEISAEEKAAQEAARKAERTAKKAERQRKEDVADSLPLSDLFTQPQNLKFSAPGFVEREDDMGLQDIRDWDVFDGKLRILSYSSPTREQQSREDARYHVYVTEIDRAGAATQRAVTDLDLGHWYKYGLYPGRDEIVIQVISNAATSSLERWSVTNQERIAEISAPLPVWAGSRLDEEDAFRYVTAEGNLFFAQTVSLGRKQSVVRWQLMTMDADTLSDGQSQAPDELQSLSNWFRGRDGEVGLIISTLATGESGVKSMLETPLEFTHDGLTLRGVVGFEMRTLLVDADASGYWQSPALERGMAWVNLAELGKGMSIADRERIGHAQMAASLAYGETLSAPSHAVAGRNMTAITPIEGGIAALLTNNANRLEHPQEHGDWLYEFTTGGETRATHLAAISKHLDGRFLLLASAPDDTMTLLLQGRRNFVIRLDDEREPVGYGEIAMPADVPPMLLVADDEGSWHISIGRGGGDKQRIWRARVPAD